MAKKSASAKKGKSAATPQGRPKSPVRQAKPAPPKAADGRPKAKGFAPRHQDLNPATRRPVAQCEHEICYADYNTGMHPATPIHHNKTLLPPPNTAPVTRRPIPHPEEDPTILRACRLDGTDVYYNARLTLPVVSQSATRVSATSSSAQPHCEPCSLRTGNDAVLDLLVALKDRVNPFDTQSQSASDREPLDVGRVYPKSMSRECIARALQRSPVIRESTTLTKCASPSQRVSLGTEPPPHCPTPQLVGFLHAWTNAALRCMDPSGTSNDGEKHLKLDPDFVFGLINHESGWNMNATSRIGNGLMQLTTAPVREFLRPGSSTNQYWQAVRDKPECAPFRPTVDAYRSFPKQNWQCSVTDPKAIGVHLIIGLSNLNACQTAADKETSLGFRFSQLNSIKQNPKSDLSRRETRKVLNDLVAICHNWGPGNMQTAFRAIRSSKFRDAKEFRKTLLSRGWAASGRDGVREFPNKVDEDLELIKKENPAIKNPRIETCTED